MISKNEKYVSKLMNMHHRKYWIKRALYNMNDGQIKILWYKYEGESYGIKMIIENIFAHQQLFLSQEMKTNVLFNFSE